MYRNNSGIGIKTNTQTIKSNMFAGTYNTLGTHTNTNTQTQSRSDNEIILEIVTCNIENLRRLVDSSNVNNVIDKKNKYTALHHAVRINKNDQIIEYLMSCGADPNAKQDEGKDAVDLAIETNHRYLIDILLKEKEKELDNLNYKVKGLESKNQDLVKSNEYLIKSTTDYVEKIESLNVENKNLKRKFDESEKAFNNVLKKTKKNYII